MQEASEAKEDHIDVIKHLGPHVASDASGQVGNSRTDRFECLSQSHNPHKYSAAAMHPQQRLNGQQIQQQESQDAEDWRQGSTQLQVSMLRRLDVSASL